MAARRGEPAFEVDPLGHGLFTYTLLRGLGAVGPGTGDQADQQLGLPPNADFNHDGVLTTAELIAYVNQNLKEIAASSPISSSAARPICPRTALVLPPGELVQHPVLQSFGDPFPLVPLAPRQPAAQQ